MSWGLSRIFGRDRQDSLMPMRVWRQELAGRRDERDFVKEVGFDQCC